MVEGRKKNREKWKRGIKKEVKNKMSTCERENY